MQKNRFFCAFLAHLYGAYAIPLALSIACPSSIICDLSARNQSYVVNLHVEFNIPLCREQSLLQISENQKSILFFCAKLWNFENSENIKS